MIRSTLDTGWCASLPDESARPRCPKCGAEIDPDTCWCGEPIDGYHDNHTPIPVGCNCHRAKE